jgi:hypothetical protein
MEADYKRSLLTYPYEALLRSKQLQEMLTVRNFDISSGLLDVREICT